MKTLIIQYPPEFDGELHIKCESFLADNSKYTYQFTHFAEGNEWDTLVSAARAIIAQDERIKQSKIHKGLMLMPNFEYITPQIKN